MTLWWDTHWVFAAGIVAASIGCLFRQNRSKNIIIAFIGGLLFTTLVLYFGVWLFLEVDPDWMVNYFYTPDLSSLALVALYPICYAAGFGITTGLTHIKKERWFTLGFAIWWIIFTIILIPRFYVVYGNTPSPEWFWEVTGTTDNFLFLPVPAGTSLAPLFLFFFVGSIVQHTAFLVYGVFLAMKKKDCHIPEVVRNNPYCYVPPP